MNRDEFHYAHTAALCAEALVASGKHPLADCAGIAEKIAWWDAFRDWLTPKHCRPGDYATQIRPREAAALLAIGGHWPIMRQVHCLHFSYEKGRIEDFVPITYADDFGLTLHAYQDAGEEGCPHWGYTGYPCRANWERSAELGRIDWWECLAARLRPSFRDRTWGHMLDPEADNIERCRAGALATSVRVWEMLSGRPVQWMLDDKPGRGTVPHYDRGGEMVRIESLISVQEARNDRDLEARSKRIYLAVTLKELPAFDGNKRPG